jgi:putative ABC transport system permease protein
MVRLAWRMLWQRPASVAATFLALWFAVVAVTACGAMLESGIRYHGQPARYAAAPILIATTGVQVTSGHGQDREVESAPLTQRGAVPASLVATVAATPGVGTVVADVATPAQLRGVGAVEAHPWSAAQLAPYALRAGRAPQRAGEAVLDERLGVAPGQQVSLDAASGTEQLTVVGVAADAAGSVFLTDAQARALSGHPDSVQVIGVLPDTGTNVHALAKKLRAQLPSGRNGAYPHVYTGAGRGLAESPQVGDAREFVIAVSSVFGGMTLLIAIFVIAGTVGQSVRQHHRDIALLRAVAATPRQVRRMVVAQTVAVGALAAALGVWPGLAGATWLRGQFVTRGAVPDSFHTHLSWLPPLVAAGSAVLVAAVAAWIASLRASRVRPTEALAESLVERGGFGVVRSLLGLIALAGGIVLCAVAAHVSGDSAAGVSVAVVFTLVTAVALMAPLLIRAATATVGRLLVALGVTGRLAIANSATAARRLSTVVSSLVLAVALGGSLWFMQDSVEHVSTQQSRAGVHADWVALPAGGGFSPQVAAGLRDVHGVQAVTGVVRGTLFVRYAGLSDYPAQGLDAAALPATVDLGVTEGSLADLRGDTVAVDTLTASTLHLHVGQTITAWYGDGLPASLRVIALYQRGLGFAAFTLPHDTLAPHEGADSAAFLTTDHAPATAAALRERLAATAPAAQLVTRDGYQAALDENLARNGWTNRMITVVLLVYTVIAAVNTLVSAMAARRREFAVLRLSGTTRRQVLRMVGWEQVFLLGLALVLGVAVAAATLLPMVAGITGSARPYVPPSGWLVVLGGTVALGFAASLLPARRVLRTAPVEAIGIRE